MTLTEIAARIDAHLKRFEAVPLARYYFARAYRAGKYVLVTYVTYRGHSSLTRSEALAYLAWLDSGKIGTHWESQR